MREIIFDTETTGLSASDGDRIIEIGAIELINHVPSGKVYHQYINPGDRDIHPDAQAVHGISKEQLKDEPHFEQIIDDFLAFFSEGRLIAHNANFDMGFFNAEMKRVGLTPFAKDRVLDTLAMARLKYPGARNSLDALCQRYGVDNSHREKHGALLDSELLAEVYIELIGGKQASLILSDKDQKSGDQIAGKSAVAALKQALPQRTKPLASPIGEKEKALHRAFIETLGNEKSGDVALWSLYNETKSNS